MNLAGAEREWLARLSRAEVAGICMRLATHYGVAPLAEAVPSAWRCAGRALPLAATGQDERLSGADGNDVVVVTGCDAHNGDRLRRIVRLAARQKIAGIVAIGTARDVLGAVETEGVPVFSIRPPGVPGRLHDHAGATPCAITREHVLFADSGGVLLIHACLLSLVVDAAAVVLDAEAERQIIARTRMEWKQFLEIRRRQPSYTFAEHLRFADRNPVSATALEELVRVESR